MCGFSFEQFTQRLKEINISYFIVIIVLLSLAFRIIYITADTPLLQLFSDEGFKTFDARNKVLFGDWHIPPHSPCYLYLHPIFTLIQYAFLSLFGIGYIQARLVSVVFSLGITVLVISMVKNQYGNYWAAVAGLFTGLNYYFIMVSRTAVIEIYVIFFMVLSIYLFDKGSKKVIFYLFSGFVLVLAVVTKLYALFLFPALMVCFILRRRLKESFYFLGGISIALIIYGLLWLIFTDGGILLEALQLNFKIGQLEILRDNSSMFLANSDYIATDNSGVIFLFKLLKSVFKRIIYINHLFIMAPIMSILTGYYLIFLFRKQISTSISDIELVCINWLLFGVGVLLISKYASIHHLTILFPPMIILSTTILKYYFNINKTSDNIKTRRIKYIFSKIIFWLLIHQIIFSLIMLFFDKLIEKTPIVNPILNFNIFSYLWFVIKNHSYHLIELLPRVNAYEFWRIIAILIGIMLTTIFYFLLSKIKNLRIIFNTSIILFFIINIGRYISWISFPKYTQISVSRQLGKIVNNSDLIIGGQFLGLENKVYFVHHHEKEDIYFDQAAYFLKMVYHPLEGLQVNDNFLDKIKGYKFVEEFTVCNHIYHLYKHK